MFIFNIVLFVLIFSMFMLRLILYPKPFIQQCTADLTSLTMLGCIPIAFFTIIGDIGITTSTASWGGHSWFLVAYAFWWINTFVMICIALLVMVVVSTTNVTNMEIFNPSMVLPFVGTATDAVVGALIVNYSDGVTARLAVPVILVSYILVGIGFWVAMLVFAIYFVRLMNNGLPPGAQSPSLCLLVGPCGQTAAAIQFLGTAAMKYFGSYDRGTFLQTNAGMVCAAVGELLGFFIIGLALFFSIFVIYVLIHVTIKREHQFSMIWWSTIFPFATVNTAWIAFATALDSPTFKVLSSIFLIALIIDYLVLSRKTKKRNGEKVV
ncbi:C4-dicarboxylate transporter/malic acid transport protein [Teratosphaeria nubilosa]|uniref:C4-dicarboxylate transporter/malic acid transport protein n=1 Tax=Teratosphaeria nubilosa TaxID=161662 RepID=A0A6G1LP33_9PEZI|nr:C4-dicarboxylate transporter/malic acid transport protein [Teratosphaeria nubilosa]